jgi:hypothetical protein
MLDSVLLSSLFYVDCLLYEKHDWEYDRTTIGISLGFKQGFFSRASSGLADCGRRSSM